MIKTLAILVLFGSCLLPSSRAFASEDTTDEIPAIKGEAPLCKMYAIVDESLLTEPGKFANAIGHMSVGLGSAVGTTPLGQIPYISADGVEFRYISQHPFIVLKGKSGKIRELYNSVVADGSIPHVEFLETMHLGPTYKQQIDATAAKPATEIKILGISLFGEIAKLAPLVRKFSLLK